MKEIKAKDLKAAWKRRPESDSDMSYKTWLKDQVNKFPNSDWSRACESALK